MVNVRAAIRDEISRLELEQFKHPYDHEERARIEEIRKLAIQQLADDSYSTSGRHRDRIGSALHGRVLHADPDDGTPLWPALTPDQLALEAGFDTLLSRLTGEQRVLLRMRYASLMVLREIASLLQVSQTMIQKRLDQVHAELREALLTAFVRKEEIT